MKRGSWIGSCVGSSMLSAVLLDSGADVLSRCPWLPVSAISGTISSSTLSAFVLDSGADVFSPCSWLPELWATQMIQTCVVKDVLLKSFFGWLCGFFVSLPCSLALCEVRAKAERTVTWAIVGFLYSSVMFSIGILC